MHKSFHRSAGLSTETLPGAPYVRIDVASENRYQREPYALLAFQRQDRPAAAPHGARTGFITSARRSADNQKDIPGAP